VTTVEEIADRLMLCEALGGWLAVE
jgi:hypothetical protein